MVGIVINRLGLEGLKGTVMVTKIAKKKRRRLQRKERGDAEIVT
jgi:hypothetical protein